LLIVRAFQRSADISGITINSKFLVVVDDELKVKRIAGLVGKEVYTFIEWRVSFEFDLAAFDLLATVFDRQLIEGIHGKINGRISTSLEIDLDVISLGHSQER
jgi:hypothetical protein